MTCMAGKHDKKCQIYQILQVNIKKTLSEEFEKASGEKSRDLRRKQKEKRSNWLLKKEQKVMPDS